MSKTREELKAAHQKLADVKKQIAALEVAADRADNAARLATAEVEKYANLDKEITAWRVGQVKKGLPTKALPEKLKGKADAKRAAEDELQQAENTRDALREELHDLQAHIEPTEAKRRQCVIAVLHQKGDELAQELEMLNARRHELEQIMAGLADTRTGDFVGGSPIVIGSTPGMNAALYSRAPQFPSNCDPINAMAIRWADRYNRLLKDPDAAFTVPKPIEPSDFVIKASVFQGPGLPWTEGSVSLRSES